MRAWGRLASALVALVAVQTARAEQYAVPILVDSEDDIFDLYDNGDITESEMDLLMELFQKKVDLNRATRDELYELPGVTYPMVDEILKLRREKGGFKELKELESRGVIPYVVVKQIETFVVFGRPKLQADAPVHGSVRLKTLFQPGAAPGTDLDSGTLGDPGLALDAGNVRRSPSVGLRSRISAMGGRLDAGWTITGRDLAGRLAVGGPESDPYLIASAPRFRPEPLRKAFASYQADVGDQGRGQVILGTYNAGFGERLTFDTTNRRRPYGLYSDDLVFDNVGGVGRFNSDFRIHRGLQGVAGTLQRLPVGGDVTLDMTGFLSMRAVDEYMYRFRPNRTYFSEAAAEAGPTRCSAERRCHAYETFRDVYVHQLGGGNVRMNVGDRAYAGFTGYGARNFFLTGDEFLEFAPSSRQPIRRSFGAVGVEGGVGAGIFDMFGEFTVTDRGAPAALLRTLWDIDRIALEVTGRYYDKRFDNPFSRGEASPAQFLGLRGRNEAGIKARAVGKPVRGWRFIGHVDTWVHPAMSTPSEQAPYNARHDLDVYLRNEIDFTRNLRWAFWGQIFDKDLWVGGRDQDYIRTPNVNYDGVYDEDDPDRAMEDLLASREDWARGVRMEAGNQLTFRPVRSVQLTAYGRLRWRDINPYPEFFERNASVWFRVAVKPVRWLDLSTRVRYWSDDIDAIPEDRSGDGIFDYQRGNSFAEGYLRAGVTLPKRLRGSLRYDMRKFTDVKVRDRDPEHLVRMSVEAMF
jgi:hypothetical protein